MKTLRTLAFFFLLVSGSFAFNACGSEESCDECRIVDQDNILSKVGNQCNKDFVADCKSKDNLFTTVTCTCK